MNFFSTLRRVAYDDFLVTFEGNDPRLYRPIFQHKHSVFVVFCDRLVRLQNRLDDVAGLRGSTDRNEVGANQRADRTNRVAVRAGKRLPSIDCLATGGVPKFFYVAGERSWSSASSKAASESELEDGRNNSASSAGSKPDER